MTDVKVEYMIEGAKRQYIKGRIRSNQVSHHCAFLSVHCVLGKCYASNKHEKTCEHILRGNVLKYNNARNVLKKSAHPGFDSS